MAVNLKKEQTNNDEENIKNKQMEIENIQLLKQVIGEKNIHIMKLLNYLEKIK